VRRAALVAALLGGCVYQVPGVSLPIPLDGGPLPDDGAAPPDLSLADLAGSDLASDDGGFQFPVGAPCQGDSDCASRSCANGLCCDLPCAADGCSLCNAPGFQGHCLPAPLGAPCGPATCKGGATVGPPLCSGGGVCLPPPPPVDCPFFYGCDSTSGNCFASCSSDMECAPGHSCSPGNGICH
jgi:hypothetical protein